MSIRFAGAGMLAISSHARHLTVASLHLPLQCIRAAAERRDLAAGRGLHRPMWTQAMLLAGLILGPVLGGSPALGEEPSDSKSPATQPTGKGHVINYATQIRPLLSQRCGSCHGGDASKGDLSLDTPESIQEGGRNGTAIVAGKPDDSLLLRRIRMPADERGHMPPRNKPQLNDAQIKLIEEWIAGGAHFEMPAVAAREKPAKPATQPAARPKERPAQPEKTVTTVAEKPKDAPPPSLPKAAPSVSEAPATRPAGTTGNPAAASAAAITALRSHLVYVEAVAQGSNLIALDFAAASKRTKDANAVKLIEPVLPQLDSISLARSGIADETVALLAKAPRLRRIDLRNTQITDKGMASLAGQPTLQELILTQTHLTDASVEALLAMPALERVYLWRSGLSATAIQRLRKERPKLRVEGGDAPEARAKEVEPPVKMTGDAPPPVVVAAAAAVADAVPPSPQTRPAAELASASAAPAAVNPIKAINKVCPISGSPISAEFAVVFKSRVIGFCCQKCASQFLQDPGQYENKVVAAN